MEKDNKVEIYFDYKRKNKWLGIIDYKSLIVLCIYFFIIVSILKFIPLKLEYIIYLFLFLIMPAVALVFMNVGEESAIDTLIVILKFGLYNKIYVKKEFIKKIDKKKYKLN